VQIHFACILTIFEKMYTINFLVGHGYVNQMAVFIISVLSTAVPFY